MDDFGPNDLAAIERDRDNIDADAKPYDWADPELWDAQPEPAWCDYCSCAGKGTDDCSFPDSCKAGVPDA